MPGIEQSKATASDQLKGACEEEGGCRDETESASISGTASDPFP